MALASCLVGVLAELVRVAGPTALLASGAVETAQLFQMLPQLPQGLAACLAAALQPVLFSGLVASRPDALKDATSSARSQGMLTLRKSLFDRRASVRRAATCSVLAILSSAVADVEAFSSKGAAPPGGDRSATALNEALQLLRRGVSVDGETRPLILPRLALLAPNPQCFRESAKKRLPSGLACARLRSAARAMVAETLVRILNPAAIPFSACVAGSDGSAKQGTVPAPLLLHRIVGGVASAQLNADEARAGILAAAAVALRTTSSGRAAESTGRAVPLEHSESSTGSAGGLAPPMSMMDPDESVAQDKGFPALSQASSVSSAGGVPRLSTPAVCGLIELLARATPEAYGIARPATAPRAPEPGKAASSSAVETPSVSVGAASVAIGDASALSSTAATIVPSGAASGVDHLATNVSLLDRALTGAAEAVCMLDLCGGQGTARALSLAAGADGIDLRSRLAQDEDKPAPLWAELLPASGLSTRAWVIVAALARNRACLSTRAAGAFSAMETMAASASSASASGGASASATRKPKRSRSSAKRSASIASGDGDREAVEASSSLWQQAARAAGWSVDDKALHGQRPTECLRSAAAAGIAMAATSILSRFAAGPAAASSASSSAAAAAGVSLGEADEAAGVLEWASSSLLSNQTVLNQLLRTDPAAVMLGGSALARLYASRVLSRQSARPRASSSRSPLASPVLHASPALGMWHDVQEHVASVAETPADAGGEVVCGARRVAGWVACGVHALLLVRQLRSQSRHVQSDGVARLRSQLVRSASCLLSAASLCLTSVWQCLQSAEACRWWTASVLGCARAVCAGLESENAPPCPAAASPVEWVLARFTYLCKKAEYGSAAVMIKLVRAILMVSFRVDVAFCLLLLLPSAAHRLRW
jgi:hypothetical protein